MNEQKKLDLRFEPLTDEERQYKANFVKAYTRPYAIRQRSGYRAKNWRTKDKQLSDPALKAHLRGDYWIATKAPWVKKPRTGKTFHSFLLFQHAGLKPCN